MENINTKVMLQSAGRKNVCKKDHIFILGCIVKTSGCMFQEIWKSIRVSVIISAV